MFEHYYGDKVRRLFILGAIVMAATLPFFSGDIHEPLIASIVGILIVSIAAGLTSPRYSWSGLLNTLISIAAAGIFEYYAVAAYVQNQGPRTFFWTNQALTLIFIVALYYSIKTIRGNKEGIQSMPPEEPKI